MMRVLSLIPSLLFIFVVNISFTQSVTNTYTAGDISTNLNSYDPTCNGQLYPLTVTLPAGGPWVVTSVDVEYSMTANSTNLAWMSEQKSRLNFQNTSTPEPVFIDGTGSTGGTQLYERTGLNIANGNYNGSTPLTFELQAYRTYGNNVCSSDYQKVDNNTWSVTVHYSLAAPMTFVSATVTQPAITPIPVCSTNSHGIARIEVQTSGTPNPLSINEFKLWGLNDANLTNISSLAIYYTGSNPNFATTNYFGHTNSPSTATVTSISNTGMTLAPGMNYFWVAYTLQPTANIGAILDVSCHEIKFTNSTTVTPTVSSPIGSRTIAICNTSPGGINITNLKTWFKADNYINGSTTWNNSKVNPNIPSLNSISAPVYEAANPRWNYNPSLRFSNSINDNFVSSFPSVNDVLSANQGTIIAAGTFEGNASITNRSEIGFCGYYGNPGSMNGNDEFSFQSNGIWYRGQNQTGSWAVLNTPMNTIPSIHTAQFHNSNNPSMISTRNSVANGSANNTYNFSNLGTQRYSIGEVPNAPHDFVGTVAEAITFLTNITPAERNRAESYLAIKYGITLGGTTNPSNYTSSNGTVIWTGDANYQRKIIGIGRDDISELLQKQSHQLDDSVRIYKGALNTTNIGNTSTFINDRSFVVMGSSAGRLCATDNSNTELAPGCGLYSKLEREWKVTRTNMNENFNIDIKLAACGIPGSVDVSDLRFLVNTTDNFANGGSSCFYNSDGTGIVISYASGTISVSGINTSHHIPNNSTRFVTIASIKSATPLPVGLLDFKSNCQERSVHLNWSTATETNNAFFTIEKSNDGFTFKTIAKIEGNGNKNTESVYSYLDNTSQLGLNYYRLSQTDFDGKETILKTISSNCNSDTGVVFHPNPTKYGVYVTLNSGIEEDFEITVYSMLGKLISTHNIEGSTWIPLPSTSGLYMLKYKINDVEKVEKIVKY